MANFNLSGLHVYIVFVTEKVEKVCVLCSVLNSILSGMSKEGPPCNISNAQPPSYLVNDKPLKGLLLPVKKTQQPILSS